MRFCAYYSIAFFGLFRIHVDGAIRYHPDGSMSSNSGPTIDRTDSSPNKGDLLAHLRSKRQDRLLTAYGWTSADVQLIMNEHNRLRRLVPATDMQLMNWDKNLASSAQAHADQCMFAHSTNRVNTGENIWASPFSNYRGAFKMWFDEVYDKSCGCTNFYKYCCGHYTQMAWASTTRVGCGFAKCNSISYAYGHHYILVCHYSPAGNIIYYSNGEMVGRPGFTYRYGDEKPCTQCAAGHKCDNGLCTWT